MMKYQAALATGLATFFVVPEALGQDELRALEDALAGTVRSIEVLTGLEAQIASQPETVVPLVLVATEAPTMAPEPLDQRLDTLRREVSLLRMELDAIESPMAGAPSTSILGDPGRPVAEPLPGTTGAPGLPGAPNTTNAPNPTGTPTLPHVSTGLDPSVLSQIRSSVRADTRATPGQSPQTTKAPVVPGDVPTIQPGAYTADATRQAKASYYAGRYADALVLLEGREDAASLHLAGRCRMQLAEYDQAIALFTRVVQLEGDTQLGRRASSDLEFAQWKQGFDSKLPRGLKEKDA